MMDMLELAKLRFVEYKTGRAIAAALIAIAEAMQAKPKFVQVGNRGIAIEHITHYRVVAADSVYVYFDSDDSYDEGGQAYVRLIDDDARVFLSWWRQHADVTVLEPKPKARPECSCGWTLYTVNAGTYDEHTEERRERHDDDCPVHGHPPQQHANVTVLGEGE